MQTLSSDYLNAYRSLELTRDAEGILVAQFHTNGGLSRLQRRITRSSSMLSTALGRIARIRS